ncbi:MAG: hypothetical protein U0075_23600 [Thermomicrobiales bacterium]
MLFDREARVMGLRAAPHSSAHAYRVRQQSHGSGVVVSGRAFTRHYAILTDRARRHAAVMDDGVLIVELDDSAPPRSATTESRAGQRGRRGREGQG